MRFLTSSEGSGTGSACIPDNAVKYPMLTVRCGHATATPLLVTISMSSTRWAVLKALLMASWSLGSGEGAAASCWAGVPAVPGGTGAGVANWPSLETAVYAAPPAGVHGSAYILGSIGCPTG